MKEINIRELENVVPYYDGEAPWGFFELRFEFYQHHVSKNTGQVVCSVSPNTDYGVEIGDMVESKT